MQAQQSNLKSKTIDHLAEQKLLDEIYAPQYRKNSNEKTGKVLAIHPNQQSTTQGADAKSNATHSAKLQKSALLRSLEAYGDCI